MWLSKLFKKRPRFDYENCRHKDAFMCKNLSTGKDYCPKCLDEKFRVEGAPIDALKNMLCGLKNNFPNALTKEELIESSKNPYKIHTGKLRSKSVKRKEVNH